MIENIMYKRDLVYSLNAGNEFESDTELGSIRVKVLVPDIDKNIPVIIEDRSGHFPLDHIGNIIDIMKDEIFNRISVDFKQNVTLYIVEPDGEKYIKVAFDDETDKITTTNVNKIE